MAATVRPYTVEYKPRGVILVRWEGLLVTTGPAYDSGAPFECGPYTDLSVQLVGTLGTAGAMTLQGTNVWNTTAVWATLTDPQGNDVVLTTLKIEQIIENVYTIRPLLTAGQVDVTDLDVYVKLSTTARR